MRLQQPWWSVLLAAVLGGLVSVTAAAGEQFLPVLGIREGALKTLGIPTGNGYIDYLTLLNARDGGINGVKLVWEECETVNDVTRAGECYERLKGKGPTGAAVFHPFTTPLVNALLERATHDKIPLLTLGGGRADASDGRVFPYVFNPPSNAWSQNTAMIRFLGHRAGGMEQLKGLKIAHVYLDNDYGRETLSILDTQAAQYGFAVQHLAVQPPGRRPLASSARPFLARGPTSRSSRRCSPMSMARARGRGRNVMSARYVGSEACCKACSPRRGCARPWANSAISP